MNSAPSLLACTLVAALGGCGGGAFPSVEAPLRQGDVGAALERYEELVRRRAPDRRRALERIASVALWQSARARERAVRDRAFVALEALGDSAAPLLEKLARDREPVASRALGALLRIDDDDQSERLAEAVHSEFPEARSAALVWLRDQERWSDVRRMVMDVDAAVRRAALDSLYLGPPDIEGSLPAMQGVLRHDPAPAVRAAAARLLARWGAEASEALQEALSDRSLAVRISAVSALARMQITAGDVRGASRGEILSRLASGEPTAPGIEAARLLGERDANAMAYLRRALQAGATPLRLQAVVAASAFTPLRPDVRLLLSDPSADLRLRAAAALARNSSGDRAAATRALQGLLGGSPPLALQAALVFWDFSDRRGGEVAREQLGSPLPSMRALAAYVVGERMRERERVRALLADQEPSVRVAAARAILHPDP